MVGTPLFPIYYIDPPQILNTFVTNIPGSGSLPLQVVLNSGSRAAYGIDYIDTTGDYIGVYVGVSGSEVLMCIVGGGLSRDVAVVIPAKSRVSLRSITSVAITTGYLTLTFLGQGINMGVAS